MQILSHRGYWISPEEKNTPTAFLRSFRSGFGIETDFRDYKGKLIISHDPATEPLFSAEEFFAMAMREGKSQTLAINIKSDGLQALLAELLNKYALESHFVFDMSVPDSRGYLKKPFTFFARHSDIETHPVWYDQASGIWLDALEREWIAAPIVREHLENGKKVALVSPELHNRPYADFWAMLLQEGLYRQKDVLLCTDYPEEARAFFEEEKS